MDPLLLARELDNFLASASRALVMEDGEVLFDLAESRYSISGEQEKCLWHLWSAERNAVRRVVEIERRNGSLRLSVQRFGKGKPGTIEVVADHERRTPSTQRQQRTKYRNLLARALERHAPEWKLTQLTSTADLEHSFSPVYARGVLRHGNTAIAVLGVGDDESQVSIDGALTFGLLWLDHWRRREAGRCLVQGLRLFVPTRRAAVVHARMHCADRAASHFELFEFDERAGSFEARDISDQGNIVTRLVRAPDTTRVHERFAQESEIIRATVPEMEPVVLSSTELAFRLHGLEFARARIAASAESFASGEEIVFGSGPHETVLTVESRSLFDDLMLRLREARKPDGDRRHPLWRMAPERWLETEVKRDITALDARLDPAHVYAQVPAFAAGDRGMIDLLTATRDGQLAVLELKADEDIHLPLQGLDYWSRVKWHHEREDFQRFGYFVAEEASARTLSKQPPLLMLVAPALRVHPATDTILHYLSREVDWSLIGVDERWRDEVKVVFRKRRSQAALAGHHT